MRLRTTLLIGGAVGAGVALVLAKKSHPPLPPVSHVDLNRYTGRWFEIARYPNRFERKCISDVMATYTALADGTIKVVNQCVAYDGSIHRSEGIAPISDKRTNAKLKVTFFWPFTGNYWVLALGDEYEYAVVGEPSRKYLWFLSREPFMEEGLYQRLLQKIGILGYDPRKLARTKQSQAPVLKKTGTDGAAVASAPNTRNAPSSLNTSRKIAFTFL